MIEAIETKIIPGAERKLKNRASLGQTVRNTLTMAYRGVLRMWRTPEQLSDVTLQPIIFTIMFTYIFGGAIAGNIQAYLPILIAGILAMTILTGGVVTTGVQLSEDMDKGVFNRFKALPIARVAPLAGALLADTIRYAIAVTIVFVTGYIIGFRPGAGLSGVIESGLLIIFFAWCLSWVFAFFGVIARTASTVQGVSLLILLPLTFLSNAFVPVKTMPSWLQPIVNANPVSHLISATRQLYTFGTIGNDFWMSLLGAGIIVAIFAPLTVRAYMRKA